MAFQSLQKGLHRKSTILERSQSVAHKATQVLTAFITEQYGISYAEMVRYEYQNDTAHLMLSVSSKSLASELLLQMSLLQTTLRAAGVQVKRIIIR